MLANLGGLDKKVLQKGNIIVRDLLDINHEYKDNLEQKCLSLRDSTYQDVFDMIERNRIGSKVNGFSNFATAYIPVVDNHENLNLLYLVKLEELTRYCEYFGKSEDTNDSKFEDELKRAKI